jgi:hypothetical protein
MSTEKNVSSNTSGIVTRIRALCDSVKLKRISVAGGMS